MKSKFCIMIPIYKEELDCTEELSLKRLYKLIKGKNYPLFFVKPQSLNTKNYYKIIDKKDIRELNFDDKYFEDIHGYSQLCLSYDFYNSVNYDYMYIYQLDCYLIEDKLNEWCEFGFDYIGGPILSTGAGWDTLDKETQKWEPMVGNGGFSLRKIETFKELTDPEGEFRKHYNVDDELINKVIYEDKYFCNDLLNFYDLNMPNWIVASKFAWDMNVDLYKKIFNIDYLPIVPTKDFCTVYLWPTLAPSTSSSSLGGFSSTI